MNELLLLPSIGILSGLILFYTIYLSSLENLSNYTVCLLLFVPWVITFLCSKMYKLFIPLLVISIISTYAMTTYTFVRFIKN